MKRVVRAGSPEVLKIIGDSSPCSAETSFRELDDVFLQTQARIWLGEVLHIRFDEETAIADLLADGELLFQVSKVVWKMLLKKYVELKHSKVHIYERTSFGKSDGRYMPYPKVDSFLKICQILGLTSVDLFSPSDVVEKRVVRRVCMCIRSLSKKARSKDLNVPDFDIVTYTIAMPTDLVGGIRRNLEQSQCSSSSSNGCSSPYMDSREIYRQKSPSGQLVRHYDSYESDEAESTFTEFEFRSPLSNPSYDAANLSNIIGENSPEGNSVVDENLSELQTVFRMDSQDLNEVGHKSIMQDGNHDFTIGLHSKSSSSHMQSQINRGAKACSADMEEVMWPLSNSKRHEEINNVDIGYYQKFASTYEDFLYGLDEQLAVDTEEAFIPFDPMLWSRGLENCLPQCSSSGCEINLAYQKDIMKASIYPLGQAQTVSCTPGNDGVRSEYMENSNNGSILGFRDMARENIPLKESIVNVEGQDKNSSINTLKMDASTSVDKVSLPVNYIGLQPGTSVLILHNIDGRTDPEVPASSFSLSKGTVDLDQKGIRNGLIRKSVDEVEVAQVYRASSLVSSEGKYGNSDCTANDLFPQVDQHKEAELCDPKLEISSNKPVSAVKEVTMDVNEDRDLFTAEKYSVIDKIDGIDSNSCVLVDRFTCDNEGPYACREIEDIGSTRTLSSTTDKEQTSRRVPNDPPLARDFNTVSCSDSAFIKHDQVSPSQSDILCDPCNTQCINGSFTNTTISDGCNGNESEYILSPSIPSTQSGETLEEGGNLVPDTAISDNKDASTSDLEMDANEQPNDSIMSSTYQDMTCKMYSSATSNGFPSKLMERDCNGETAGELKMKGIQQKDTSHHPSVTYKDMMVEVKGNYIDRLSRENSSNWHPLGENTTCTNTSEYVKCCSALNETGSKDQGFISSFHVEDSCDPQIKLLPMRNYIGERQTLSSLAPHHMDTSEIHGLEIGGMNSLDDLNILCTQGSNVLDGIESADIHYVNLEALSNGSAFETISTQDPVHRDYIASSTSSTQLKDSSMQTHEIFPCSIPACLMEREINAEERKKDTEECKKELAAKLDSSGKDKERATGNRVLKSFAGAMTLIGALFLFHHMRRKRDKEKNSEILVPRQTHKPSQEVSMQKRVAVGKSDVLYPGERLKF